jgi:hypothetical protein
MFAWCEELHTIDNIILSPRETFSYSNMFARCSKLEQIRFEGNIVNNISFSACTKLSKDSIISIMSALSDTATGMKVTFSQLAVDIAFQTNEGDGDGSTSVEWENLCATKPNWTIALA